MFPTISFALIVLFICWGIYATVEKIQFDAFWDGFNRGYLEGHTTEDAYDSGYEHGRDDGYETAEGGGERSEDVEDGYND